VKNPFFNVATALKAQKPELEARASKLTNIQN